MVYRPYLKAGPWEVGCLFYRGGIMLFECIRVVVVSLECVVGLFRC
jgi:hypothetical protein